MERCCDSSTLFRVVFRLINDWLSHILFILMENRAVLCFSVWKFSLSLLSWCSLLCFTTLMVLLLIFYCHFCWRKSSFLLLRYWSRAGTFIFYLLWAVWSFPAFSCKEVRPNCNLTRISILLIVKTNWRKLYGNLYFILYQLKDYSFLVSY